jgi:hypothetical protein
VYPQAAAGGRGYTRRKKVVAVDPLESREPDRGVWIGEGEGEVDYQ